MAIRRITAAVDRLAVLTNRVFLAELVVVAMQVINIGCHLVAIGADPGAIADPVACINDLITVGT